MSYLGSVPYTGTPFSNNKIQVLSGNGSNTEFTLDYRVNGKADVEVIVNNVQQNPFDGSYDVVNNNVLIFSGAPSSGSNNIHIYFRGYSHNVSVPEANTIQSIHLTTNEISFANTITTKAIVPDANVTHDIGTSSMRYKDLYLANSTIYIGTSTVSETAGALQIASGGNPAVNLATIVEATDLAANAYSNSVSTASADATSKAATAYSNAVATASADATTKAATAYTNAVAYAASNVDLYALFVQQVGSSPVNISNTLSVGNTTITGTANVTANLTANNVRTYGSVQIDGDLVVSGNTVTVSATNLAVEDNMIYLNDGSAVANPDLGIAGNYNDGTYAHAGFFRDATDARWKVFDGYTPEPDASAYIDTSNASFRIADIQANTVYAANGIFTSGVSGITTLATGNTTITGFANVSGTGYFGNVLTVKTPARYDGNTNTLASGAIVCGGSSDTVNTSFANSTAIFRIKATDQSNYLQFGIGLGGYQYGSWVQSGFDNSTSYGGASHGASNLLLQPIGGNVGIGTQTPSSTLTVVGNTYITGHNTFVIESASGNHTRIHALGDGYGGSSPLVITADRPPTDDSWFVQGAADYNGNEGGSKTTYKVAFNGAGTFGYADGATGTGSNLYTRLAGSYLYNGTSNYGNWGGLLLHATTNMSESSRRWLITNSLHVNKLAFIRSSSATTDPALGYSSGTTGAVTSGTADLVIDSSGSVGIGNTSPIAKFHVTGTASENYASDATVLFDVPGNNDWGVIINKPAHDYGLQVSVANSGAYGLRVNTGFRVNGSGDVYSSSITTTGSAQLGSASYINGQRILNTGEYSTQGYVTGSFSAGNWYTFLTLNGYGTGTFLLQFLAMTWNAGGSNYTELYSGLFSVGQEYTNSTMIESIPVIRGGHAPNTETIQFRYKRNGSSYAELQWTSSGSLTLDNTSGKTVMYTIRKIFNNPYNY